MRHFGEHEGRQVLIYGYSKAKDSFMFSYTDTITASDLRWIKDVLSVPAAAKATSAIEALDLQKHPVSGKRGFDHAMATWSPKNVSATEIRLYDRDQSRHWFKESNNYLAPNERRAADIIGETTVAAATMPSAVQAEAPPLPHPIEAYSDRSPGPPIPVQTSIDIPGITTPLPAAARTLQASHDLPPAPPMITSDVIKGEKRPAPLVESAPVADESVGKAAETLLQAVDKLSTILDLHARLAKMERAEAAKKREADRKKARAAKAKSPQQLNG